LIDIHTQSQETKISVASRKMAIKKLEKDLEKAINYIDSDQTGFINFEMLGVFLYSIGVFKIIFNPNYGITIDIQGKYSSASIQVL
jgi:hypothetical protein